MFMLFKITHYNLESLEGEHVLSKLHACWSFYFKHHHRKNAGPFNEQSVN